MKENRPLNGVSKNVGLMLIVIVLGVLLLPLNSYLTKRDKAGTMVRVTEVPGFSFEVPKEVEDAKQTYEEFEKLLANAQEEDDFQNLITDTVVCESDETTYTIVKLGKFDLMAFTIDGIEDVTEFKTVKDFTDKCYIGDVSLTERNAKSVNSAKTPKQIFGVTIGVIENEPQYTEDMFEEDSNGELVLNQDAVQKAVEEGTLEFKSEYVETNIGYLSLISDKENKTSYGVLVGYSVDDDSYKAAVKRISESLKLNDK